MSIQHEKNKQITQDQVNELLTHKTRVATNMEKVKTGYDRNYYSMEKTMQDRQLIDDLLKLPESTTMKLSDEQKYRLRTIQGRNLSHILLNQNSFTGDSDEMKKAKKYVQALENLMSQPLQKDTMNQSIADLETAYLEAIAACKYYCDHKDPSFESGRDRKQAVADALERLRAESAQLSEAKRLLESGQLTREVTSVQDLLVAAQKSLAVNELERTGRRQKKTGLEALTFDSFARMIGTHNRGQVELDGNGLKMINNGKFSLSNGVASVENRLLRERFLVIVMQKLGEKYVPSMYERIRNTLGLDQADDRMLPLSRQQIRDVVAFVNDQTSMVDKVLHEGKEASGAKHRFALEVDHMIGGQVEDYERARTTAAQEQILKKEIQTIFDQAKKDGMDVPELTKHQMDNLVKGNISRLRDGIFQAVNKIYGAMCSLNGGEAVDFNKLAGTQSVFNRIAAYTIIRMTAETEAGRRVAHQDLDLFIKVTAFELSGKKKLAKDFGQIYVGNLAIRGAMGLEGAVENRLPKNKTWQKDPHKVKRGMDGLAKLCDAMRKISNYEEKAFFQGLTEEQAADLQKIGNQVVELLSGESHGDLSFVANELKGTRFAEGFKEANALAGVKDKSLLLSSIESIVKATTIHKKNESSDENAVAQQKKAVEKQEEPVSRADAFARLSLLSDEGRAVANVLLLETTPASLIKDASDETIRQILVLRTALNAFPEGEAYAENLNLAGVNLRLEQSKGGLLQMKLEGETIAIPYHIRTLIKRMDIEMIDGKNKEGESGLDLYGKEYARQILESLDPKSADEGQIRHIRNICFKIFKAMLGKKSPEFENVATEDLYVRAKFLLEHDEYSKKQLETIINVDIAVAVNEYLINDQETLELMKKAQLELRNGTDKVQMAQQKVEDTDELQWTPQEKQIQDLLADLIYSKETWETDALMDKKDSQKELLRKTLRNHTDAILTLLYEPQVLEDVFLKMNPLQADEELNGLDMKAQLKNALDSFLNSDGLKQLMKNKNIIRNVLPLLLSDNENVFDISNKDFMRYEELQKLKNMDESYDKKELEELEKKNGEFKTLMDLKTALNPIVVTLNLKNRLSGKKDSNALKDILDQFQDAREQLLDRLYEVDQQISAVVKDKMDDFQDMITAQTETLFKGDKNKEEKALQDKTLDELLKENVTGEKGMSLFMKNVLTGYFKNVSDMDRRAMLASALRSAKPQKTLHKLHQLKPLKELKEIYDLTEISEELKKIPDGLTEEQKNGWLQSIKNMEEENARLAKENEQNEKENEQIRKENQQIEAENQKLMEENARLEAENIPIRQELEKNKDKIMGNYLGGFLKGAGPLLQKMLQGMPVKDMPKALRNAVEDMKSNLAPIPQEVVQARLLAIVNGSDGNITKIEVVKAMGAASVAQAFFCKLYGPSLPKEGKDVVIKLLRPDVHNRMLREKNFMLDCAARTDEGMKATYEGQLEKIEEELDFRIEAEHVAEGNVYNDGVKTVQTMKVEQMVAPTTNTLVLEKAPGTTLDSYIKDSQKEVEEIISKFQVTDSLGQKMFKYTHENQRLYESQRNRLVDMLNQMKKRQVYLAQLTEKWVNEGIFGREDGGFYHGDLHAGNLMIDDDQLTVIDFGNAVKLSQEQQKRIIRMMMAATAGEANDFLHEYHKLLSDKSEAKYNEKRDELQAAFHEVFKKGKKKDIGKRISVALSIAQNCGLELPAEVANFSASQMRLQNAMDDMNKQIEAIQTAINTMDEAEGDFYYVNEIISFHQKNADKEHPALYNATQMLKEREMDREEVLAAVRSKNKEQRKAFDQRMNIPAIKKDMQAGIESFRDCVNENGQTKEERRQIFDGKKNAILETVEKIGLLYDTEEIARFYRIRDEIKVCLEQPFENTEKFEQLSAELLQCKNMNTYEERLTRLRQAQDAKETPKEELVRLENEFLQLHEKLFHLRVVREGDFHDLGKDYIASLKKGDIEISKNELKSWFADEKNHGKELEEAYQQLRAELDIYTPQVNAHYQKFYELLDSAFHMDDDPEAVLTVVREKSEEKRQEFAGRLNILGSMQSLRDIKNALLELDGEPESDARKQKIKGQINAIIDAATRLTDYVNPEEYSAMLQLIDRLRESQDEPWAMTEYVKVCDELLSNKSLSGYERALDHLRKAQDDEKTPVEELARLEKEFLVSYQDIYREKRLHDLTALKSRIDSLMDTMTLDSLENVKERMKGCLDDTYHKGAELMEELQQLIDLKQKESAIEFPEEKLEKFLEIYRQAISKRFHDILTSLKKEINQKEPDSFFDVMGEVLSKKLATVGSKVGWKYFLRYSFKSKPSE